MRTPKLVLCLVCALALGIDSGLVPVESLAEGGRDRLVIGLKAFRDGFHDLAAKELRAFLKAAPDDPRRLEILFILSRIEIAKENWPGARRVLEEITRGEGPRAREAPYWIGWVLAKEGNRQGALELLDAYLQEPGGERRADALVLAAELAREEGDLAGAANRLAAHIEEAPKDPRRPAVWLELLRALKDSGQVARARDTARRALADPAVGRDSAVLEAVALAGIDAARAASDPGAEAAFWAALAAGAASQPLRLRARFEEGLARLGARDVTAARRALEAYLKAAPQGTYAAHSYLLLADLMRQAGDRAGALSQLEAALERPLDPVVEPRLAQLRESAYSLALALGDPKRAAVLMRELTTLGAPLSQEKQEILLLALARDALKTGDVEGALGHWNALPPGSAQYRTAGLLAARTLIAQGRPADALKWLEPLLVGEDPGAEAHLVALAAAEAAGDLHRAAELCAEIADQPPPGVSGAEYLHRRAAHLEFLEDLEGYTSAMEELAHRFPGDPRAVWAAKELQKRAFEVGDWDGAVVWAEGAKGGAEGDPTGEAAYLEAEALSRLDRTAEAEQAFRSIGALPGPFRAKALARLGVILDRAGKPDEAQRVYRQALDGGLEGDAAAWVKDRLASFRSGVGAPGE
jgi:tetratricopeptide (TPR) repeat protein